VIAAPGLGARLADRLAWLVCLYGIASCSACGEGEVAELRAIVGPVQRDFAASQGTWRGAPAGSVFGVGDGLRTGQGARAELKLMPDGRLRVEADTVVRFSDVAPTNDGGARQGSVDVETGSIELESGASELLVEAPAGIARVSKNSRVRVRRSGKDGVGLEVAVGRAEVERGNEVISAGSGETLALAVGRIEVEREPATPAPAPVEVAPVVPLPVEPGATEVGLEASLEVFELEVPAGETATVHDPRPPITVGFATQGCEKGVELDVRELRSGARRVRAPTTPALRLGAGSFRYSVRCIGDAAGSTRGNGLLRVVRDSGGRSLPRTAPKISLDADGRRYNLRYQNLLPELRLRWPRAPEAASYQLELTAEGGATIREQGSKPEIRLRSGRVREGEYRFSLSAGAARSPETSLRVTLDDTARTAQVTEPKDLVFSPGSSVRVAGAALASSMVRVGNVALTVGGDGRFAQPVIAPPAGRALAVRVQHPIAGVHYYVRRPAR
jgi:hypothetical protein